jgi:hypothetical protein
LATERKQALMQKTRSVAFRMAQEKFLEILQKGQLISIENFEKIKGPIRLRLSSGEAQSSGDSGGIKGKKKTH